MRYSRAVRVWMRLSVLAAVLVIALGTASYILYKNTWFSLAGVTAGVVFAAVSVFVWARRRKRVGEYLRLIENEDSEIVSGVIPDIPIPVMIANIDGSVKWYNEKFGELFGGKNALDKTVESIIPGLKWANVLKQATGFDSEVTVNGRSFNVAVSIVKDRETRGDRENRFSAYLYFIDRTELGKITKMYNDERTDVIFISIDNYDEVTQKVSDNEQQRINSLIRGYIGKWADEGKAILKKTDRDRYFMLIEHRYLELYKKNKFDILDNIRNIREDINVPVTASIGIGAGGSLSENEDYARNALEMTLGRGGDQVCVKDTVQYKFYGGKTNEYEKSTRVKTRSVAIALKDFIKKSDKVVCMGHFNADYDCFGAAMGMQRAVRALNKEPYIIYDGHSPAIDNIYSKVNEKEEYSGMFVSPQEMLDIITKDTLLIILDTHRPSMLPSRELLSRTEKVVLIDHHRRSTEFISPCSLVYHEPYASSACEMVTELLEYMDLGGTLSRTEAECLYMGILMDTKNFILKTGVRTFEAASYLKRLGLNTVDVKKMFNISKADYDHKVDIVKTAVEIAPSVALANGYERLTNIKVIASQAADEMLGIDNIRASFVVYPLEDGVGISARSFGEINVQLIMETLGGGGHMTVAGAQLKGMTIEKAAEAVRIVVLDYLRENNK